jgi:hypothetical protein
MLHDDVLLAIFDFYVNDFEDLDDNLLIKDEVEVWQLLVHVCERWRSVVFGSPRRLTLRLVCTPRTPVLETLDIWPAFPLVVHCYGDYPISGMDNILAALKYRDRICKINIEDGEALEALEEFPWEEVLAVMEEPFPELTDLMLASHNIWWKPILPDSFLGGSAPRLRLLQLDRIPFPGLPILLSSATHLVHLRLYYIPHPCHISPKVMATCLSTLTSLESLSFGFTFFPIVSPTQKGQPRHLSTRFVLPALTDFAFTGIGRYLEDFVARIDSPKLNKFSADFPHPFGRDTPQLDHFISRTPGLQAPENAPRVTYR